MDKVKSVKDIIKMCSDAIDDLIGDTKELDNSVHILSDGIDRLLDMTKDSQHLLTGDTIPNKIPISEHIEGGAVPLLVKYITNLEIFKNKSLNLSTDYFSLFALSRLFLAIVKTDDGHQLLKDAGLPEALAGLSDEMRSNKYITTIRQGMNPLNTGGHRRSKKYRRSKKTKKVRRSRKRPRLFPNKQSSRI